MKNKANEILELKTTVSKIKNSLDGLNKLETAKERFSGIEDRSKRFNTKKNRKKPIKGILKADHMKEVRHKKVYILYDSIHGNFKNR